jgi:hypothetical protein
MAGAVTETAVAFPEDLPPTTFRCGRCGAIVARFDSAATRRSFRLPVGAPFRCLEHGELARPDMRDWYAEWIRRGTPARLNIKLSPV